VKKSHPIFVKFGSKMQKKLNMTTVNRPEIKNNFENPIWRTDAILKLFFSQNSAADKPIWAKKTFIQGSKITC